MRLPKRYTKKIIAIALAALGVAVYGNSCGKLDSGGNSALNDALCTEESIKFDIIAGAETASISYGDQVKDSMIACTGLSNISQKTLDEYNKRQASLSEAGSVLDVNPPLVMAHTAIAVEICDDLYNEEMAMLLGSPTTQELDASVFKDLNTSLVAPSLVEIGSMTMRMARKCWGRDASEEEMQIISEEVENIISSTAVNADAHRYSAISVCTSVLASIDGMSM